MLIHGWGRAAAEGEPGSLGVDCAPPQISHFLGALMLITDGPTTQRKAAIGASLAGLGTVAAALLEHRGAGVSLETLGLGAILAPLIFAPALTRLRQPPLLSYLAALASLPLLRVAPRFAQVVGVLANALWLARACQATGEAPPAAARHLARLLLALASVGTLAAVRADHPHAGIRLLLLLPVLYEALAKWRNKTSVAELRRALLGWILLATNLTPLVRAGAEGEASVAAAFLAAGVALSEARAHGPLGSQRGLPARRLVTYAIWICVPFLLAGGSKSVELEPRMDLGLPEKLAYFEQHRDEFDVVFVGDSRTLCGVHPELLDPLIGQRSINLAAWAHWFPTQYPFFQDLLPLLRDDVRVVWLIGHQNFVDRHSSVSTQYGVPLSEVPLYLSLGFSWNELRPNLVKLSPLGAPLRPFLRWTKALRARADAFCASSLYAPPSPPGEVDPFAAPAEGLIAELKRDPATLSAVPVYSGGGVTSVAVQRRRGGYLRYEVNEEFFRGKQAKSKVRVGPNQSELEPGPGRYVLFERILDMCARAGVRLVVVEVEEAPHTYERPQVRERYREFMRKRVQPAVEQRGFAYLRPDWDLIEDAHYFDYNHLNHKGVERFTPLLARTLAPQLGKRKR